MVTPFGGEGSGKRPYLLLDIHPHAIKTVLMGLLIPARLSSEDTESILSDKLRWILEASSPMAVIVFGSAARGEMTEASDLDLALVYPDEDSLRKGRASVLSRKPRDSWPVDLLFSTRKGYFEKAEKGGVFELIMREGRVIHGGLG